MPIGLDAATALPQATRLTAKEPTLRVIVGTMMAPPHRTPRDCWITHPSTLAVRPAIRWLAPLHPPRPRPQGFCGYEFRTRPVTLVLLAADTAARTVAGLQNCRMRR